MSAVKEAIDFTAEDVIVAIHAGQFTPEERQSISRAVREKHDLEYNRKRAEAKASISKGDRVKIRTDVSHTMHEKDRHLAGKEIGTVHKVNRMKIVVEVDDGVWPQFEGGSQVNVPAGWLERA